MNSIEMSDIDGDALTIISRGSRAWITCTSGLDEVTVGPFPTHVLRRAVLSEPDGEDEAAGTAATPRSYELARALRQIPLEDPDAVAEHLVSLSYRRA